ncbi:hypothetical protein STEG23_020831, partial [Scotinomys teguina]
MANQVCSLKCRSTVLNSCDEQRVRHGFQAGTEVEGWHNSALWQSRFLKDCGWRENVEEPMMDCVARDQVSALRKTNDSCFEEAVTSQIAWTRFRPIESLGKDTQPT